ncbi:hypothetical protein C5C66_09035 [Rathayibacter toxicus]|nr:hypothetical protein APU90_07895 [Rathayibacter toxicus]PPH21680.1 hypothetical protein C5D17_09015 [Rathayibacter toxicus]PPH56109.1 hypothetical protein C5D30_09005 [Rathayibacter toxicus]PPH58205.1 hypothetical protein C5C93_09055 [Rathayibacter toxicus]PPH62312.1 hypothetical protein C5D13_09090 [Rathayibacter toxicus]
MTVNVSIVRGFSDRDARRLCLDSLVDDLVAASARRLVIEQDDSIRDADRRMIRAALQRNGYQDPRYEHTRPTVHPLLWVADAVAWCHQARGEWVGRVAPLVGRVSKLP